MKRIKLNHGTARVDDNCSDDVIRALNELSTLAFHNQQTEMKESEKIKLEIDRRIKDVENDDLDPGKDWDIHRLEVKRARAERMENFESKWLHKFEKEFPVEKRPNESFTISTRPFGKIDFFPKSNKLLFRVKNEWRKNGLNWMVRNLLKMK